MSGEIGIAFSPTVKPSRRKRMKVRNWETVRDKELHERFEITKGVPEKIKIGLSTGARLNRIKQREKCEKKVKIFTEWEAKKKALQMENRHPEYSFRYYTCPICFAFHLTKVK